MYFSCSATLTTIQKKYKLKVIKIKEIAAKIQATVL